MTVDMHHHLVFGVDDGARSMDMSVQMMQFAASQGVNGIVCTSHITPGYNHFPMDTYQRNFEQLNSLIAQRSLSITLYTGNEILYTEKTPEYLRKGKAMTVAGTKKVLIEFPPSAPFEALKRAAIDISDAGFEPVFAHIERYLCLRDTDLIESLREDYLVSMQMNALTVLRAKGLLGDRWVKKVLKHDLIDFVASDAHNVGERRCRLGEAIEVLTALKGAEAAKKMVSPI